MLMNVKYILTLVVVVLVIETGSSQGYQSEQGQDIRVVETRRKITTTTLTEDNVIDNKPVPNNDQLNKPNPSDTGSDSEQVTSERVSYNISIIHSREPVPNSAGGSQSTDRKFTCPDNQFGNVVIGCRKCQCNDNIDLTDSGNCDPFTGKCLKCLYNTEGDHCERCKSNYTGDATKQLCRECVCNQLGTDPNGDPCHPLTGQCSCYPHVEGLDCSKCKLGYYNFSSGHGCQPCKCDSVGSSSIGCNDFDGKCDCNPGYGGLKCNECPLGQFGDPKVRCQMCNCNRDGSENQFCDVKTGQCKCHTGIGGEKCDRCARGYTGFFPNCESCGECFEQWDQVISVLKNQTQALLDRVKLLLEIGTTGAYAKEFTEIENKLERIKQILDNQKLDENAIRDLARQIDELSKLLKSLGKTLTEYEKEAESVTNRTIAVQDALRDFDKLADRLTILIDGLRENATQFKEWNVDSAYATILDSQNRSREAEKRVRDLKPLMLEQEQKRRMTENMLTSTAARYNSSSLQNEAILASLARQISELENNVPGINKLVCASTSTVNTCDQLCGGALCNKCGGLSCSEGATTKASNALDLAQQAWDLLNQKYNQSKLNLEAIMAAKNMSEEALRQAKLVMTDCEFQKSKFDKIGNELNGIMDGVDKFSLMEGARPAEVRTLGTECLALSISLKPEQILDLARRINETISSLTNIEKIHQATAGDLATAEQLHQQADRAKEAADNILETVEQVLKMLQLAAMEQAKAATAIAAASKEMEAAQSDLQEISTETELLVKIVLELTEAIKKLKDRLNELRKKYAQNELYVSQAKAAADEASKLADQAEKGADELEDKVKLAEEKLRNKGRLNGEMKDRAERLKNDALQLADEIRMRMDLLRELDDMFDESVKRVKDYQDIVDDLHKQMNQYLKDIDQKAQYYRECQT
uniref:Laminin subunit beta-2 n=1 Tax=Aceria tosichella TaxID=561515 RepID=A0A6G1S5Q3_9ACAR